MQAALNWPIVHAAQFLKRAAEWEARQRALDSSARPNEVALDGRFDVGRAVDANPVVAELRERLRGFSDE